MAIVQTGLIMPFDIDWGSKGGPGFTTSIVKTRRGREQRNCMKGSALWSLDLVNIAKSDQALWEEFLAFWRATGGNERAFLAAHPADRNFDCVPSKISSTSWQSRKLYLTEYEHNRNLAYIEGFTVTEAGTVRDSGDYTLDNETGIVTGLTPTPYSMIVVIDRSHRVDLPCGANGWPLSKLYLQTGLTYLATFNSSHEYAVTSFGLVPYTTAGFGTASAANTAINGLTQKAQADYEQGIDQVNTNMGGASNSIEAFLFVGTGIDVGSGSSEFEQLQDDYPDARFYSISINHPDILSDASYGNGASHQDYTDGDTLMKQLGVHGHYYVNSTQTSKNAFYDIARDLFGFSGNFYVPMRFEREQMRAQKNGIEHNWPTRILEVK